MGTPVPALDRPVVSIIVPARNEEASLSTCLESLVSQTGLTFEIIVVDEAHHHLRVGERPVAEEIAHGGGSRLQNLVERAMRQDRVVAAHQPVVHQTALDRLEHIADTKRRIVVAATGPRSAQFVEELRASVISA